MFAHRLHNLALTLLALVAFGLTLGLSSFADANAEDVTVEVEVLLAKNDHTGIPPDLANLRMRLTQQFSQFTGFTLDSRQDLALELGQERSIQIPDGLAVAIEYLGESDGSYRLRITLPGGSTNVSAPADGLFFVGGPELSTGTLILAIRPH